MLIAVGGYIYLFVFGMAEFEKSSVTAGEADEICREYIQTECESLESAYAENQSRIDHDFDDTYRMYYSLSPDDQLRITKAFAEENGKEATANVTVDKQGTRIVMEHSADFLKISITFN